MINYAELITALQGCELLPDQARQLERVLQEHARMWTALEIIAAPVPGEIHDPLRLLQVQQLVANLALDGDA